MGAGSDDGLPVWRLVSSEPSAPSNAIASRQNGERTNGSRRPGSRTAVTIPRPGQRIRLLAMPHDPDPIPPGTLGTVGVALSRLGPGTFQVAVEWDGGFSKALTELDHWEPM